MRKFFWMVKMLFTVVFFMVLSDASLASDYSLNKEVNEEKVSLNNMVVKGRKIEERLSAELGEFGHPVVIITGKEIEEAGFVDLNMALRSMVPGLYSETRSGRGGYNRTSIHGSHNILWLLDGVRINNRLYGGGWSYTISVHNIERIEILKGGESLFYGTGARAGVINIITKGITKKATGQFGVSYGNNDYREVYGHVTDTVKGHGLMAFGSYEGYDGYHVLDKEAYIKAGNTEKRKPIGFDRSTIGLKYRKEFDVAGKGVLNSQLRKQQGYFDYPYPHYRVGHTFNDWEETIGILKWDHDINDNFSYYLKSHFHIWEADCTFMNLDGSYRYDAALWKYEDYGVNLMTSIRWGNGQEILSGIDYQNYWGIDQVVRIYSSERTEVYGFFANYRPHLSFSPDTKLAIGVRYNTTNEGTDCTVWDVSILQPIAYQIYLRGVVGKSFTVPTSLQLYGNDPSRGRYGNPDLKPENSLNAEIGIGGNWRYFHCDVGYFYHGIEDMIKRITLANGDRTYKNVGGKTKIDGFEVSAGVGPFRGLSFSASATWTDAEDKDSGKQVERIPKFYASANVRYRYPSGWFGADLMTRYTGDVYERGLAHFNDVNYGDVFIVDASAFVMFGREKRHRLTLRVENVFDKKYASRYNVAKDPNGNYFLYHQNGLPWSIVIGYTYTF
ncbi:TonB-dependent receptor [Desulfothermus naphthae]